MTEAHWVFFLVYISVIFVPAVQVKTNEAEKLVVVNFSVPFPADRLLQTVGGCKINPSVSLTHRLLDQTPL